MTGSGAFAIEPDDLVVLADELTADEFDDLLAAPAAQVELRHPDFDPADQDADDALAAPAPGDIVEAVWLEEGVVAWIKKEFDKDKHPRWPKGTPKGGEFMQVGERFVHNGKPYEITAFQNGKVYAHLATGGKNDVELLSLSAKDAATKKPAPPVAIKSDKHHSPDIQGTIVIDPYVDSGSHNPSLPKPANWHGTEEQWKRFGEVDQERLIELDKRFGAWSSGKSKTMIAEIKHQYESSIQSFVADAFSSQYGSSSGHTLSLSGLFHGTTPTPATMKKYEECKLLLEDAASALQWDLYHRTKAPDVSTFHWGHTSPTANKAKHVGQGIPLLAAYSLSTGAFQTTQFGSNLTAVPMAIRHVQMHTHSGGIYTSFSNEYEITTGHRMKLDDRAVFLSNSGMSAQVKKYLSKMAKAGGEPASGAVLLEVAKAINDPSYELPVPLEPLSVKPVPQAGSQNKFTVKPPEDIGKGVFDLPYAGGSQEAAKMSASQMGLQPGDFIEGLKGTRYIIAQGANGSLLYCKVDPHTKKIDFNKVFPVSSEPFYRLEGHVNIPEPKAEKGFQGWSPQDYAGHVEDKPGAKKVSAFKAGEMFLFNGEAWKVETPYADGNAPVVISMNTGKKGLAEAGAKAAPLVAKKGYVPSVPEPEQVASPEPKSYKTGDFVKVDAGGIQALGQVMDGGAVGNVKVWVPSHPQGIDLIPSFLSDPPEMPGIKSDFQPGDKFQWDGIGPYTVTSVLKDGTVRAKFTGGKVMKFKPSDLNEKTIVYRPSTWALGNTTKAGDLDIGDAVQAGAGAKIRPYVVEGKFGSKVFLRNLESGDVVAVTKNKSFARLVSAEEQAKGASAPDDVSAPKETLAPKLVSAGEKPLKDLQVGDMFEQVQDPGAYWTVSEMTDEGGYKAFYSPPDGGPAHTPVVWPKAVLDGATVPAKLLKHADEKQIESKPSLAGKFDQAKFVEGEPADLKELAPGDVFLSATGIAMQLKSNAPKGGATAVALHNGKIVKNISYSKKYKTLVAKDEVPFDHANLIVGDSVLFKDLEPGDKFLMGSGHYMKLEGGGLQVVNADGSLGVDFGPSFLKKPELSVKYLGLVQPVEPPSAPAPDLDPGSLEKHPDYATYLHPKSGKHKYPQLEQMPAGTVFTDKSGKAFKIVKQGGTPIISDGEKHFQAEGTWRGKISEGDVAFSEPETLPQPTADDGALTVGDLKTGDHFVIPEGYFGAGKTYVVTNPHFQQQSDYTTIKARELKPDGSLGPSLPMATSLVPAAVTPQAEIALAQSKPKPKIKASEMQVGDIFTITDDTQYQLIAHGTGSAPAQIKVLNPSDVSEYVKPGEIIDWSKSTTTPSIPVTVLGHRELGGLDDESQWPLPKGEWVMVDDGNEGIPAQIIGHPDTDKWQVKTWGGFEWEADSQDVAAWDPEGSDGHPMPFEGLALGSKFAAHGAIWDKLSGDSAEIVAVHDPDIQKAPVGHVESLFQGSDEVHALDPDEASAYHDDFKVGDTITGKDALETLPPGSMIGNGIGNVWKKLDDGGWENTETSQVEYGAGGSWTLTGLPGDEPSPAKSGVPAKGEKVNITSGPWAGKTGTVLEVEPSPGGATKNAVVVATDDGLQGLVKHDEMQSAGAAAEPEPVGLGTLPDGSVYKAQSGVTFKKLSWNKAVVLDPGDEETVFKPGQTVNLTQNASVVLVRSPEQADGESSVGVGSLQVGDHFTHEADHDIHELGWKVTGKTGTHVYAQQAAPFNEKLQGAPSVSSMGHGTQVFQKPAPSNQQIFDKLKNGDHILYKGKPAVVTDTKIPGHDTVEVGVFGDAEKHVATPGDISMPAPSSAAQPKPHQLAPYLHPKSGKYKYPKLAEVMAGTVFTDKKNNKYVLLGHVGDHVVYADQEGNQFSAPALSRVKVITVLDVTDTENAKLSALGSFSKLEEASAKPVLRMSSTGRFLVAA